MNLKKIKSYSHILILISSNLSLILAFYFSNGSSQKSTIPKNHKLLLFPIELFVPLTIGGSDNYVTLYDEFDKIVVRKALIHSKGSVDPFNDSNLRLVEIEDDDLFKLINFKGKKLRAFPMVDSFIKKEQDSYEFTF